MLEVRLSFWPKTRFAVVLPDAAGVLYSSTRKLLLSPIYRLSALSTAAAVGRHKLFALTPPALQLAVLKLPPWPNTMSARVASTPSGSYSSTP